MAIKPEGTSPIIIPADNVQTRWGDWEASLDTAGAQAGTVLEHTWSLANSANQGLSAELIRAEEHRKEAVAATEALQKEIDPNHPDSVLWNMSQEIDRAQNEALEAQGEAIASNELAIRALNQKFQRTIFLSAGMRDEYFSYNGSTLTALGDWAGEVVFITNRAGSTDRQDSHEHSYDRTWFSREMVPSPSGRSYDVNSGGIAIYTVTPGVTRRESLSANSRSINTNWDTLITWRVPKNTNATVNASMTWANKTLAANYGFRITLDNNNITSTSRSGSAPTFGHAARNHNASVSYRQMKAGQTLRLQAYADHSNSLNREARNIKMNITWIDSA